MRWPHSLSRASRPARRRALALERLEDRATPAQLPINSNVYLQTNGPDAPVGRGDWYSASAAQLGDGGYHYLLINVPAGWTGPLTIQLRSPQMNSNPAVADFYDEVAGPADTTQFELYAPGTPFLASKPQPGDPGSVFVQNYLPEDAGPALVNGIPSVNGEPWKPFFTIADPQPGVYVLRAQTGLTGAATGLRDDQNGWAVRVGFDATPPANGDLSAANVALANDDGADLASDRDGVPGTNDELTVGVLRVTYQHDIPDGGSPFTLNVPERSLVLYQYVPPGSTRAVFHNFDFDPNTIPGSSLRLYLPDQPFDPANPYAGGVDLTDVPNAISQDAEWNGGVLNDGVRQRVGFVIDPGVLAAQGLGLAGATELPAGYWLIVTTLSTHNQYIQEGITDVPTYYEQPPTPRLTMTKTDGRGAVAPGESLTYRLTVRNTSTGPTAGAANDLVITDPLPAGLTYTGPLGRVSLTTDRGRAVTGTLSLDGNLVVFALDGWLNAGEALTLLVPVRVNENVPAGTVFTNQATVTFRDNLFGDPPAPGSPPLGNLFPPVTARDDLPDTVGADLSLVKTVSSATVAPGGLVTFTLTLTNSSVPAAPGVSVRDLLPPGLVLVSAVASQGTYDAATGVWTVGTLAGRSGATLRLTVRVTAAGPVTNTAEVVASGLPDPDSTPGNYTSRPGEDDGGAATVRVVPLVAPPPPPPPGPFPPVPQLPPPPPAVGDIVDPVAIPAGPPVPGMTPPPGFGLSPPAVVLTPAAATASKQLFLASTPAAAGGGAVVVPAPGWSSLPGSPGTSGGTGLLAVGSDAGAGVVRVFDLATGALRFALTPYGPAFAGGVRVASADVTGDGVEDVVTAPGFGGGPNLKVFDGVTGAEVMSVMAFAPGWTGGLFVAAADVDADGFADLVAAPDAGAGPHVVVISGRTGGLLASFFAYAPVFAGGVRVAAADLDGDGAAELVLGAGPGGGPHVQVRDGRTLAVRLSFFAFDPLLDSGVTVAAGDVAGRPAVVVGAGAGGGPAVAVFDGATGSRLVDFFAFAPAFAGGVRVGVADADGDGRGDVAVGGGAGQPAAVRLLDLAAGREAAAFLALDPAFLGGVFVG